MPSKNWLSDRGWRDLLCSMYVVLMWSLFHLSTCLGLSPGDDDALGKPQSQSVIMVWEVN